MHDERDGWTRTTEALPETGEPVLVIASGQSANGKTKYISAMVIGAYDPKEREWYIDLDPTADIRVTHWRPLPDMPAGAELPDGWRGKW